MDLVGTKDTIPTSEASSGLFNSILIAEDDPVFRHLLQSWLKKWNYRVVTAENGLEAWRALQQKESPQLAIVDWMMPGMEGVELCQRIRSAGDTPYRYILLLTAKDHSDDIVAGLDAGADDYLVKPFRFEELNARIRAGRRILKLQDDLLRAHSSLAFEAAHDPLTGLWNRGAIFKLLQKETQRHLRTGTPLGVMMADIDYFKAINDSYGHLAGDAVLREVGSRLESVVRGYDSVGRYGGEEFLILVPGCTLADLALSAERIRASLGSRPIHTDYGEISMTLSIGFVASYAECRVETPDDLVRLADAALYSAKANGRNRVEGASHSLAQTR